MRAFVLAAVAVACLAGGCSDDEEKAAPPPPKPKPAPKPAASTPPREVPPPKAPEPGTTLLTTSSEGASMDLIPNSHGLGFSFVEGGEFPTVTSYDVLGRDLGEARGEFDDDCGVLDVAVPGLERLILTQLITEEPAEGINPAKYSLELTGWGAKSNEDEWTTPIPSPEDGEDLGCGDLAVTSDGRWGVLTFGLILDPAFVVDLRTGKLRPQKDAFATLGEYVLVGDRDELDEEVPVFAVTDPATGRKLGTIRDLHFENERRLAPRGGLVTDSGGGTAMPGITSDGKRLIALPGGAQGNDQQIVGYSLPGGKPLWRTKKSFSPTPIGNGGGVFVFYEGSDPERRVKGLDDRTGEYKWSLPEGEVCAMTDRELLMSVNSQLATIDIRTGEQLSFDDSTGDCPTAYPGGIATESDGLEQRVVQVLNP